MRAYNFGGSGRNLTKFYQVMWLLGGVITCTLILQGVPPTKFGRVKNVQNVTTFEFDRKYLRNGSTYRKNLKTSSSNTFHPLLREKNFVNFGSLTNKLSVSYTHLTLPTIYSV